MCFCVFAFATASEGTKPTHLAKSRYCGCLVTFLANTLPSTLPPSLYRAAMVAASVLITNLQWLSMLLFALAAYQLFLFLYWQPHQQVSDRPV